MTETAEATETTATKYEFFVYIVESPSAPDIYHRRSEGGVLSDALRLDSIPCVTRTAINFEAFVAALRIGLPEAMTTFPGRYPILHISAHGAKTGIQLSSGELVNWSRLRELLLPINESLSGALVLCMSSCEGYSACQMAMEEGNAPHPYYAMIGHYGKPTWSDAAIAYLVFYHRLGLGHGVLDALAAMRSSSGDQNWTIETAEESKQGYIEYLANQAESPADVQQDLESVAEQEDLPAGAKALVYQSGG